MAERTSALKNLALCRTLSEQELATVASILQSQEVPAGVDLFREGDPGDGLYLVISGAVDVIKRGPRGERSLARLGPGGVLGEMSLITHDVRSATGRAVSATRVLRLPASNFRAMLEGGSVAALKIAAATAEVLAHRLGAMNATVLDLADRVDPDGAKLPELKDSELADLHRKMQVWSF